jgi:hypothetical protein
VLQHLRLLSLLRRKKRKPHPKLTPRWTPLKAHPPRIKKPKLLRSNPTRKSLILSGVDPSDLDGIDDEDIYVSYRRPDLVKDVKVYEPDEELPKDIQWKLFLARQVALAKYRELHGQERA